MPASASQLLLPAIYGYGLLGYSLLGYGYGYSYVENTRLHLGRRRRARPGRC